MSGNQINIVTSICVDTDKADQKVTYPWVGIEDSNERRLTYWKLVFTFVCSSVRCNPNVNHLIYTNDQQDVVIQGIDIRKKISDLGVKIIFMPFERVKPPQKFSKRFKNAYYKLEVLGELAKLEYPSVLVDSDCLWVRYNTEFNQLLSTTQAMLVYDIHKPKNPYIKEPDGISNSSAEMGELYKQVDPNYPEPFPIWFGSEFIGGSPTSFNKIYTELQRVFDYVVGISDFQTFIFPGGKRTLFDNDELFLSFSLNKKLTPNLEISKYMRRIFTSHLKHDVVPEDENLTIWHLPAEKMEGLQLLFNEAVNPDSNFWKVDIDNFSTYLGEYVGIPKRKYFMKHKKSYIKSTMKVIKKINNFIKNNYQ